MLRNVIAIIVCYLSCYQCDNRYNDRYNELVKRGSLKESIDSQLPKESKFFDMNDFDCEYYKQLKFFRPRLHDSPRYERTKQQLVNRSKNELLSTRDVQRRAFWRNQSRSVSVIGTAQRQDMTWLILHDFRNCLMNISRKSIAISERTERDWEKLSRAVTVACATLLMLPPTIFFHFFSNAKDNAKGGKRVSLELVVVSKKHLAERAPRLWFLSSAYPSFTMPSVYIRRLKTQKRSTHEVARGNRKLKRNLFAPRSTYRAVS